MSIYKLVDAETLSNNFLRPKTFGRIYGAYYNYCSGVEPEQVCVSLLHDRFFYYYKVTSSHDLSIKSLEKLKMCINSIIIIDCIFIDLRGLKGEGLAHHIKLLNHFNREHLELTIIIALPLVSYEAEIFEQHLAYETKFLDGAFYTDDTKNYRIYKDRNKALSDANF